MIIGGMTQYLAQVQGMPKPVEKKLVKRIRCFIWDEKNQTPVAMTTMTDEINKGGRAILDLEARNEAIEVMWLKSYLQLDENRPLWGHLADALIAHHMPSAEKKIDPEIKINIFQQSWKTQMGTKSGLPDELRNMLKIAQKYRLEMDAITTSRDTLRSIPIWYHKEADKKIRHLNNSKASRCLRTNHHVRTTGEAEDLAAIPTIAKDHLDTDECECTECNSIESTYSCEHPNSCMKKASEMLNTLPPKWDPRNDQPNDYEYDKANTNLDQEWTHLEQRMTSAKEPKDLFRIFAENRIKQTNLPAFEKRTLIYNPIHPVTATISGYAEGAGTDDAKAGVGVLINEQNKETKISIRVPRHLPQTKTNAEIIALAIALKQTNTDEPLDIVTTSDNILEEMTKHAETHEDEGFINLENPEPLKNAISHLRKRKAPTRLKVVPADKKTLRNKTAEKLAKEATEKETTPELHMDTDHSMFAAGAKLSKMTQARAYRLIKKEKQAKVKPRRRTEEMVEKTKAQIEEIFGFTPDSKSIWRSIRHKDFSKKTQQFLWRIIHEAYMLADKWLRDNFSEELKERAYCTICSGKLETMEHILTECESTEQTLIWRLAEKTWVKKKGPEWFKPGIGGIAGAALAGNINARTRKMKKGESRLWRILITESAYLIWLLRCEREMREDYKPPSKEIIVNRWEKAINDRLQLDRRMSHRKFETKAISASMVKGTWKGILKGEKALPEDWVTKSGVLVGIDLDDCCSEEDEEREEEREDDGRDEGGGFSEGNACGSNRGHEVHTFHFDHQSPTLRA
ncbi:hypothetical protein VNI00_010994 [Paramarasmius palmivorus]|uniref:RNase H type-1 domain-containing protein n=1 Tax=Paramarasmius palmivorus TaxID=297713 RepID=A0AAW0CHB0_9AGAR